MSRVVNPNSPGKVRNYQRRTIAELLRRLSQQQEINQDVMDMAAAIVLALRAIDESVLVTIEAWEKRDYWQKADRFMREWEWAGKHCADLQKVVTTQNWGQLPMIMAGLFPYFADIELKKMTRPAATWQGAYRQLLREPKAVGR